MPRQFFLFERPSRFVAGTVGEPGDRVFFLQAIDGPRVVSVALEKQQVVVRAHPRAQLIAELVARPGPPRAGPGVAAALARPSGA